MERGACHVQGRTATRLVHNVGEAVFLSRSDGRFQKEISGTYAAIVHAKVACVMNAKLLIMGAWKGFPTAANSHAEISHTKNEAKLLRDPFICRYLTLYISL